MERILGAFGATSGVSLKKQRVTRHKSRDLVDIG